MRSRVPRENDKATHLKVEAVHWKDLTSRHRFKKATRACAGIDVTGPGGNGQHPMRLVDYDKMFVLENNLQKKWSLPCSEQMRGGPHAQDRS